MNYSYSRKTNIEQQRNNLRALLYVGLSIVLIVAILVFGIGLLSKLAVFVSDLTKKDTSGIISDSTPPPPPQIDEAPDETNKNNLDIKGSAEPGSTVTLYFNSETSQSLTDSSGNFVFNVTLTDGENSFYATAKDAAANVSNQSRTVSVIYDIKPPELAISSPQDNSKFSGSKQKQVNIQGNSDGVSVTINDRVVILSSNGNFNTNYSLADGQNTLLIVAKDKAGNTTEKTLTLEYSP